MSNTKGLADLSLDKITQAFFSFGFFACLFCPQSAHAVLVQSAAKASRTVLQRVAPLVVRSSVLSAPSFRAASVLNPHTLSCFSGALQASSLYLPPTQTYSLFQVNKQVLALQSLGPSSLNCGNGVRNSVVQSLFGVALPEAAELLSEGDPTEGESEFEEGAKKLNLKETFRLMSLLFGVYECINPDAIENGRNVAQLLEDEVAHRLINENQDSLRLANCVYSVFSPKVLTQYPWAGRFVKALVVGFQGERIRRAPAAESPAYHQETHKSLSHLAVNSAFYSANKVFSKVLEFAGKKLGGEALGKIKVAKGGQVPEGLKESAGDLVSSTGSFALTAPLDSIKEVSKVQVVETVEAVRKNSRTDESSVPSLFDLHHLPN